MMLTYCPSCLEKQRLIDELKDEIKRLKDQLRYQERTRKEGAFGSSTPSSKVPIKPNSLAERQARRGGGRPGHVGHGRRSVKAADADRVERVTTPEVCPDCGGPLDLCGLKSRTVVDCVPVRVERVVYRLEQRRCAQCGRRVSARAPGVLPKALYSNRLLAHVAFEHYVSGLTLGYLERQTGVGYSSLVAAMHLLARRLESVPQRLVEAYRQAPVKHADETGWRTDGRNGYAWLFATTTESIYRFRRSRSAAVARDVLGTKLLPGVLVVDRYGGYNKAPCALNYCYAHLLRDLEDVEKNFPDEDEARRFVAALAPLLAQAMEVRNLDLSDQAFLTQAANIKQAIIELIQHPARHPAIQTYQDLFRQKADRLYHWADDRRVPADNNFAERELRSLVGARKVSYGSQSEAGDHTREILMTVLFTLKKRTPNPADALRHALDQLALDPTRDPYDLLFPPNTS